MSCDLSVWRWNGATPAVAMDLTVNLVGADSPLAGRLRNVLEQGHCVVVSGLPSWPSNADVVVLPDPPQPLDAAASTALSEAVRHVVPAIVVMSNWTDDRCHYWLENGATNCLPADPDTLNDLCGVLRYLSRHRPRSKEAAGSGSAEVIQAFLRNTRLATGWVDASLHYGGVSPAMAQFDNRPLASYAGMFIGDASPWAGPAVVALIRRVLLSGEPVVNVDVRYKTLNLNVERACVAGFFPVTSAGGAVTGVGIVVHPSVASDESGLLEPRHSTMGLAARALGVASAEVDSTGHLLHADESFRKIVGYSDVELASLTLRDIVHPQDLRSDTALFDTLLGGAQTYSAEQRWVQKGGTTVPVRMALARDAKENVGATLIAIDLSELHDTQALLRRSATEAKSAVAAKDRFLAMLSHELRTPLTPVLATVFSLEKDPLLPSELLGPFELIRRNVELEARLIDDLLDLTRISKGTLQLNMEVVDLHVLLRQAVDLCHHDAATKTVHLTVQLEASRWHLPGDPARLKQIFWNLIRNAIKFTPSGGTVIIRTAESSGDQIRVIVSDTGIGMEPETVGRIFSAFEQEEQTLYRQFGGLGLGLTISKALVDLHKGSLTVNSAGKHRGTTFAITLPVATPPAAPTPVPSTASPRLRVLIVEDHEDTVRAMKRLLERSGYEVNAKRTVSDAIAAVRASEYDLLISDIGLPDGSGIDLMRQLRQHGSNIRGIAISGFGMEDDVRRSKEAGFQDHMTKPVNFARLQQTIATLTQAAPAP